MNSLRNFWKKRMLFLAKNRDPQPSIVTLNAIPPRRSGRVSRVGWSLSARPGDNGMNLTHAVFSRQGYLLALTMVGLVAINLVWLLPTVRNIQNSASTLALSVAARVASDINSRVDDSLKNLSRAAEEIAFEPARKEFILKRLLKHNFGFRNVALVSADGSEELRVDQLKLVTSRDLEDHSKDTAFYLALEGASTIGSVYVSPELELYSSIAVPVSRAGNISQVLVADFNLRELIAAVKTPGLGEGHIYVVDRRGFQIIHPDIGEIVRHPNYLQRPVVEKVLYEGRIADGLGADDSYVNETSKKVFTVGFPLAGTGWGLFFEQPRTQAFNGQVQAIAFAGATVLLGMLIFMIVSWSNIRLDRLNSALKDLLNENYESGKMLVQRDRELVAANENLLQLNLELNEVTKVLIRRDIELSEANTRLQELDRVKSEFVSVAAHQLRTPLTGIRWSYHALLEEDSGKVNSEQRNIIEKGLQAAMSMIDLINNLLNVARIEEGRFGYNFERKSVMPTLEKAAKTFQDAIKEKGLRFVFSAPKSPLPLLDIDEEKMIIVFNNLLDNAVKYTPPGGEINVNVSALPKSGMVVVEIKDTGIGIPANQLHRIFSKFFRADNAMFYQTMGNGLGLYVVKNIVERHAGSIRAASTEGRGTTFTVRLPVPVLGANSKK